MAGLILLASCLLSGAEVEAHAFAERYDLPLPFELYLVGAGVTVGVSFLVMALFLGRQHAHRTLPSVRLWRFSSEPGSPIMAIRTPLEILSVTAFLLIVVAGIFGSPSPTENIAPVMVWVVWWVGVAFVSMLLGDLWRLVNPFDIIFRWFEKFVQWRRPGQALAGWVSYPEWLAVWPAVVLFIAFAWCELLWVDRTAPRHLVTAVVGYAAFTWTAMLVFGRRSWLEHGEVFTLVFSLFARFAPLEARRGESSWGLYLRPYGVGLLTNEPVSVSFMVLVLSVLSTVAFDGLIETPAWFAIMERVMQSDLLRHFLLAFGLPPPQLIVVIKSIALVAFPILFVAAYLAVCALMWAAGRLGGGRPVRASVVAGSFVLSLVSIAIAYHVAHYLLFLLQAGQLIIPLLSDPFGVGWDLFGTASYQIAIGVMNARSVWYLALVAIVLGHIIAVYLAHVTALRLYGAARPALWSQVPMVFLMVSYTITSLWILSQPIVA